MENAIIIGVFAAINLAVVIFFWSYSTRNRKVRAEKIKELLQDLDLQNHVEMKHKISRAKTEFLTKMGQEVRFPLNTIMGFNDLILSKKNLDHDVLESASKIHDSCTAILSMVDDILDFSKIECGKLDLIPVDYDLAYLINSVISSNMVNMEFKSIKFNLNVDPNLPGRLTGDEGRVKQIFGKILSNAFKYTRNGAVDWNISFNREGDDILLISKIKDTGIGIKQEQLVNLFSGSSELIGSRIDGMRLGLAITKEIVDRMGGTIEVESEYGKGSEFTVKIKQKVSSEATIDETILSGLKDLNCGINKEERSVKPIYIQMPYAHILVVDDMALNLEVALSFMRPYGMQIDAVPSGKIAVAKLMNQSTKYSAIFMDYMMPEMDGVEAVKKIRSLNSDYAKNIPIIALTANAMAGSERLFLESGFNDFLIKPVDIMKLDAVLNKWVRDKSKET